ncbi:MAG: tetratricopeptide repeat protein [Caulobacteraceae bacterium]
MSALRPLTACSRIIAIALAGAALCALGSAPASADPLTAALEAAPARAALAKEAKEPKEPKVKKALTEQNVADIERAIDEKRFIDAGSMVDMAVLSGSRDPVLVLLSARLDLGRGRYDQALDQFRKAQATPQTRGAAMEGEGLALALSGRQAESIPVLQKAVTESPGAWRAWNALGGAYDDRRQWAEADDAYAHALAVSNAPAIVLNNRGYSYLLRNRLDEASADFVEALRLRPDLAPARTNLRLAIALKGEYGRATAGAQKDTEASLLNNAGFAALVRGDYARAEDLLRQAIQRKGEYYDLATANLELVRESKARAAAESHVPK